MSSLQPSNKTTSEVINQHSTSVYTKPEGNAGQGLHLGACPSMSSVHPKSDSAAFTAKVNPNNPGCNPDRDWKH